MADLTSTFAAGYERNEQGWLLFPRDVKRRKELFPQGVFDHPAKANMYLVQELINYLTKPGDTILDPFGGTGTLLIGALSGRNIVLIEIEPHYLKLLEETQQMWREGVQLPVVGEVRGPGRIIIYEGDCRQRLQDMDFLCDAAIFSPPYANILSSGGETRTGPSDRITSDVIQAYGGKEASSLNLGRLNPFYFEQAMNRVYERLHARLVPGSRIAVISKDAMRMGKRLMLSEKIIRQAAKQKFELEEWHKWAQPMSSYRAPAEARGFKTVGDEDILIFGRK